MKNIKVCFHHPNYIYNFKIDLIVYSQHNNLLTLDFSEVDQQFTKIRQQQLIVTAEEGKMLDSLSILFKKQFIKKYQKVLQDRKSADQLGTINQSNFLINTQNCDYLGAKIQEHFLYFYQKLLFHCNSKNSHQSDKKSDKQIFKLIKELYIYLRRIDQQPQHKKQVIATNFSNLRFLKIIIHVLDAMKQAIWQKGEVYTFYFCMANIIYTLLTIQQVASLSNKQNGICRMCSNISIICFKSAKKHLKFSMLTQISEICFKIWNFRINNEPHIEWVHDIVAYNAQSIQLLQFIITLLVGSNCNVSVINDAVNFLQLIRDKCETMNELLMFITSCINQRIIPIIDELFSNYRIGSYKIRDTLLVSFSEDISDNFGRKIIRLREKEYPDTQWNKIFKNGYKVITSIKQKFAQFKTGRIFQHKTRKLSVKQQHFKAKQEIEMLQSFEKHQQFYSNQQLLAIQRQKLITEIRSENKEVQHELKKAIGDNLELVKINKWYEQLVNQKTIIIDQLKDAVSEFVNVKQNYVSGKKMSFQNHLNEVTILPTQKVVHKIYNKQKNKAIDQADQNNKQMESDGEFSPQSYQILPPLPPSPLDTTVRASNKSSGNKRGSYNSSQNRINLLPPPPPITMPPQFTLPPPPPLPSGLNLFRNGNQSKGDQIQIRTINWTTVEISKIKDSFWEAVQQVQIDHEQINQFFSKVPQKSSQKTFNKQIQRKSILQGARAKNIEIVLKKIKVQITAIPSAIENLDDMILTHDNVQSLLNILPTDKEIQQYSQISLNKDSLDKWSLADQYFLTIFNIPNFEEILKAIRFKGDFEGITKILKKNIADFVEFFTNLQEDKFLKNFFAEMLSIGNYMNQNNSKGNAYGFRFESIQKTYSVSSSDNKMTLFQYILKSMYKRGVQFPHDSKYYKSCFVVPMQVLRDDLKQLRKMCQNVQQCLLRSPEDEQRVTDYFLAFYIEVREQISLLDEKFNASYKVFKSVTDFYCQKLETEKIVTVYNQFKSKLKKVTQANMRKWKNQ